MLTIAAAYYVDDSVYPNMATSGSAPGVQQAYWRNMVVMMASARRMLGPAAELVVYSNSAPTGAEREAMEWTGTEVREVPFRYQAPPDYYRTFGGAFYLFDAMQDLATRAADDDLLLFIDPDCVFVADPALMLVALEEHGALSYSLDYDETSERTSMSRRLMQRIFAEDSGIAPSGPPAWFGGEFAGFTGVELRRACALLEEVWDHSMARYRDGRVRLNTQEQLMSYVWWRMGHETGNANGFVRRIWASPHHRSVSSDVQSNEFQLVVWHLPGEKKRGLIALFDDVTDRDGPFWATTDEGFRVLVARRTGVIRGPARIADDLWRSVALRTKHRLEGRRRSLRAEADEVDSEATS